LNNFEEMNEIIGRRRGTPPWLVRARPVYASSLRRAEASKQRTTLWSAVERETENGREGGASLFRSERWGPSLRDPRGRRVT
jgi:hypothetical protein